MKKPKPTKPEPKAEAPAFTPMLASSSTETPHPATSGEEYSSLRVVHNVGIRGISGSGIAGGQINAGKGVTIHFRGAPYPHFEVLPAGIQIPLTNIASATPKSAAIASVRRRVEPPVDRTNKLEFLKSRASAPKPPVIEQTDEAAEYGEDEDDGEA